MLKLMLSESGHVLMGAVQCIIYVKARRMKTHIVMYFYYDVSAWVDIKISGKDVAAFICVVFLINQNLS